MQTQELKTEARPAQLAQQIFEALNAHDLDRMVSLASEDVEDRFLALDLVARGRGAVKAFFSELVASIPDCRLEPLAIHESGDVAVTEWRVTGTFDGAPWQGIVAHGGPISIRGVDVMTFRDGRMWRNTIYMDGADVARQLGVLPPLNSRRERVFKTLANAQTVVRRRMAARRAARLRA